MTKSKRKETIKREYTQKKRHWYDTVESVLGEEHKYRLAYSLLYNSDRTPAKLPTPRSAAASFNDLHNTTEQHY